MFLISSDVIFLVLPCIINVCHKFPANFNIFCPTNTVRRHIEILLWELNLYILSVYLLRYKVK